MAGRVHPETSDSMPPTVIDVPDQDDVSVDDVQLLPKPLPEYPTIPIHALWRFATFGEWCLMIIAAFASMAAGVINPVAIMSVGDMISSYFKFGSSDAALMSSITKSMYDKGILFGGLAIAVFVATYVSRSLWIYTAEKQCKRISILYLRRILEKDMAWFDLQQGTSQTARLAKDLPLIKAGIGENMGSLFAFVGTLITALIISFKASWKLTLVMLALQPLLIFNGYAIIRVQAHMTKKSGDAYARAASVAEQALTGIRTVYAFSLQQRFVKRYADSLEEVRDADRRKGMIAGWAIGVFNCLLLLIFSFGFWYATQMVANKEIIVTDAVVVLLSMMVFAASLMSVPTGLSNLASAQAAANIIYNIIANPPTSQGLDGERSKAKLSSVAGDISFRNVHFSYPARPNVPILKGLSVDIQSGQTVAFVGGSGSGKSTTIALLQRYYEAASGFVSVDGQDVRSIDISSLRMNIGAVGQEPVLFALTIKQNILLGTHEDVAPDRFIAVCKMAQCHDFISKFPMGYDTPLVEGMLSGGQKQRIAIARALIKNPNILLLDEATSALDTKSEKLVQKALDAASHGRTTLVIAHRLSTIRNADMICVLDNGVLVEQGTHDQLYAQNGIYTQLVNKQKLSVGAGTAASDPLYPPVPEPSAEIPGYEANAQIRQMLEEPSLALDSPDVIAKQVRLRLKEESVKRKIEAKEVEGKMYWRVNKLMKPEKTQVRWGTTGAAFSGMIFPGFALILGMTIAAIMKPGDIKEAAYKWIRVMPGLAVASLLSKWGQIKDFARVNAQVTMRLRIALFENLLRQEMGFFDAKSNAIGVLTNKLGGAEGVPHLVTDVRGELAQLAFTIMFGIAPSFAFSVALTGVLLCLVPFILFASWWQTTAMSHFAESSKDAVDQATQVAIESIREVKTLKALSREDFAVKRYEAFLAKPFSLSKRNAFTDSIPYGLQSSAAMLTVCVGLFAGKAFMDSGKAELSGVLTAIMGMLVSMLSIAGSAGLSECYARGRFAARTTFGVIDRRTQIDSWKSGFVSPEFRSNFAFRDLVFKYPTAEEPIFRGEFNLVGSENKSLALVGPSGCGKSTIIGLLQRWYDATAGTASVGGAPIRDYDVLKGLRCNMALVGQEPILFDMTIAENIAWGSENAVTRDDIVTAARQANVESFVAGMPEGYETRVGQKGGHLSGGQKQRIAIARALIRKPKLLLLDEATSALDSTSEVQVQKAIDAAAAGRTTVSIAHRLSTIKNFDAIAVVHEGRVVEYGTHDELVKLDGVYAVMCKQQDL
ncbi:Multidrug resistance protein 1 [Rhizophlyctis rosea]|uniref:Multidrug resistance protein 1 n=1 Tax=Rhizophlyctis rosea TaxID=64517 RepID=A0AAD5SFB7_9FUNG|nr:Multidrug resistance protein 1 [Rhizophlyctis rosea]